MKKSNIIWSVVTLATAVLGGAYLQKRFSILDKIVEKGKSILHKDNKEGETANESGAEEEK